MTPIQPVVFVNKSAESPLKEAPFILKVLFFVTLPLHGTFAALAAFVTIIFPLSGVWLGLFYLSSLFLKKTDSQFSFWSLATIGWLTSGGILFMMAVILQSMKPGDLTQDPYSILSGILFGTFSFVFFWLYQRLFVRATISRKGWLVLYLSNCLTMLLLANIFMAASQ
jgi:hypothetical protein